MSPRSENYPSNLMNPSTDPILNVRFHKETEVCSNPKANLNSSCTSKTSPSIHFHAKPTLSNRHPDSAIDSLACYKQFKLLTSKTIEDLRRYEKIWEPSQMHMKRWSDLNGSQKKITKFHKYIYIHIQTHTYICNIV